MKKISMLGVISAILASVVGPVKAAIRNDSALHNLHAQPIGHSGARNGRHPRPSVNERALYADERRNLVQNGTCFEKAGVLRVKKKLSGHLPTGHDFGGTKRGAKAIGVNGIRAMRV